MSLQCGIVGLPNVGKSTLFSALVHRQVLTDTYPFTTIEPNIGVIPVPDDRLDRLAEFLQPEKVIPTTLRVVDIAGLIKGSHHGEGLGNQFLGQIREVDALIHLVRCFNSKQVTHITPDLDPIGDIEIVETELILKDLATVSNRLEKATQKAKSGDREAGKETEFLNSLAAHLNRGTPAREIPLDSWGATLLKELFLITTKPVLYVGNESEEAATAHQLSAAARSLLQWGQENEQEVIILSATLEHELAFLENNEERQFFMAEWGLEKVGLEVLIKSSYRLLNLITFFTTESNHVQAWTVQKGATAPEAAGQIHTDFARGFIRADVYHYEDLINLASEVKLREKGKIRSEGRDYLVQDGDIIQIKFNV
ncbi:MAG: redox-regulated ATPase YchF [Fidelibacterota bacterium]